MFAACLGIRIFWRNAHGGCAYWTTKKEAGCQQGEDRDHYRGWLQTGCLVFHSINSRLLLSYFALMVCILGIVTLSLILFLVRNPSLAREAENNLVLAANALRRQQLGNLQITDRPSLENAASQADTLLNVRVALIAPDGTLLAD